MATAKKKTVVSKEPTLHELLEQVKVLTAEVERLRAATAPKKKGASKESDLVRVSVLSGKSTDEVQRAFSEAHKVAREDQERYKELYDARVKQLLGVTRFGSRAA
jgi:uncharacterized small protein (DUF1192 family)